MYIIIKENVVGIVKNGVIVEAYDESESVVDIYEKSADKIESKYIGEKPKSDELIQLNCNSERCTLNRSAGQRDTVDPKTRATDIRLLKYI